MRRIRGLHGAWIAILAAAADRVSKAAVARLAHRGALIPGIVNLRPVENRGAAFSMLWGQGAALILLTVALIAGLLAWLIARPEAPRGLRTGLWLIVGGGLGNLYDRLFFGVVADFIELAFVRFAVFNIADVCICAGAALAVIAVALDERKGKRAR
ncbi:MAG: signal peptidase II [Clostridia bacterium]|nr:signal peptidase II [Clostridia bacterium]